MKTKITFNEETYEFISYHPSGVTQPFYGVHINGSLLVDWHLFPTDNEVYNLTYSGLETNVTCSLELTFDDVVKVVSYIRSNQ